MMLEHARGIAGCRAATPTPGRRGWSIAGTAESLDECRDAGLKAARATYEDLKRNTLVVKSNAQLELRDNLIDVKQPDGRTSKVQFVCAPARTDPKPLATQ